MVSFSIYRNKTKTRKCVFSVAAEVTKLKCYSFLKALSCLVGRTSKIFSKLSFCCNLQKIGKNLHFLHTRKAILLTTSSVFIICDYVICEDRFLPLRWGKKTPLQAQDRPRDDPHWFPGFLNCCS